MFRVLQGGYNFTPAELPATAHWDFGDPTTMYTDAGSTLVSADGQGIYQINDKAGSNNLIQTTSGSRPTYKTEIQNGRSVGRFDGIADFLLRSAGLSTGTSHTIFLALDYAALSTEHYVIDSNTGRFIITPRRADGNLNWGAGAWQDPGVAVSLAPHVATFNFASSTGDYYENGVLKATAGFENVAVGSADFTLGAKYGGSFGRTPMDCYELIWYSGAISTYNRKRIEGYLLNRWGIA